MAVAVVSDVVEFLRAYPPFSDLAPDVVDALANAVEVEFHPAGAVIFAQGAEAVEALRVVRSGLVEVVHDGRTLDAMGPGEIFGHGSMLSGLPTGFEARAAEDTLTYRIPGALAAEALAGPRALAYVTRLLLEDRHQLRAASPAAAARDLLAQPVRAALRAAPVVCAPGTTIREAARAMRDAGATALVVTDGHAVGIVTDADLRNRVVAEGRRGDDPVSAVMTFPAITVAGERPAGEVLLDMLERGVRHFPVTGADGRVVGVVEDHDLVAAESRASFALRRAIRRAVTVDDLVGAAAGLRPALVAAHRAGTPVLDALSAYSVVVEALTRRAMDLAVGEAGDAPVEFAWLALGSLARREALPSSDLDSAVAWLDNDVDEAAVRAYLLEVTARASATLARCGLRPDENRVSAADPLFVRSLRQWRHEVLSLIEDPTQEKGLVIASVLVDSRPVWGVDGRPLVAELFSLAAARPTLVRLLGRLAVAQHPPTGFVRGRVLESSGEHGARLDLKRMAAAPIVELARWAGLRAGVAVASTTARLEAAREAGVLDLDDALVLRDAFELTCQLRLEHQVAQLEAGAEPDDLVEPAEMSPLARTYLKEAFRAVASVQRRVANETGWAG